LALCPAILAIADPLIVNSSSRKTKQSVEMREEQWTYQLPEPMIATVSLPIIADDVNLRVVASDKKG